MQSVVLISSPLAITTDSYIMDDGALTDAEISIADGVRVEYCLIPSIDASYTRQFSLARGSLLHGSAILVWQSTDLRVETAIIWDDAQSTMSILAIAQDGAQISVEGIARVDAPYRRVVTRVDQTNILIGTWARVRGMPVLRIATDDIEWGHSCRVHRLGWEAMYYLQSRGLPHASAESLLLSGEISRHLETVEESRREEVYGEIEGRMR
jgi:Fe-S cluster assembly scaffold protein SufB